MPSTPSKWLRINDFRPGIVDNPGTDYPAGQAQIANTYRCIADRQGALIPLPARTVPSFDLTAAGSTPSGGGYAVSGLYVPNIGLLPLPPTNENLSVFPPHEVFVGIEWLSGGNHRSQLLRFRVYETPGNVSDLIKDITFPDTATTLIPNGIGFGTTRVLRSAPTTPGVPVVMASGPGNLGAINAYLTQFPNDATPTLNTPFDVFTGFLLAFVCHQGRTILQIATAYDQGVNTQTFMGENMIWTPVNDSSSTSAAQVFIPENPSGFAFMASMSANELFAVKARGGLYVSGDVADPTVVSLPMVVGSSVSQTPAITSAGVVYGSRTSGIWLWAHGDTSQLLSEKLDGDFWTTDSILYGGVAYQFASCDEWVLVPNNYILDTSLKSWWRLEDPSVVTLRFFSAFSRYIYGAKHGYYTNESPDAVHRWDREGVGAASFSWQSQPMWETIDRSVTVREAVVRARGVGTVKVTCYAHDGTYDSTILSFEDATHPVSQRGNLAMRGESIVVRLESTGANTQPAPTIYDASVQFYETNQVPSV